MIRLNDPSSWVIVDGVDTGALHGLPLPAPQARASYHRQLHGLFNASRGSDPKRQVFVSLEQTRPWVPEGTWPVHLELPFDRGTGAALLYGLLMLPLGVQSIAFISNRYHRNPTGHLASLPTSGPEVHLLGQLKTEWIEGTSITSGPLASFLGLLQQNQSAATHIVQQAWLAHSKDIRQTVEASAPFLPHIDLFDDVILDSLPAMAKTVSLAACQ
ncbi:MAG: hypothetical protein ACFB9M_04505 [Myxococcota bacterium]